MTAGNAAISINMDRDLVADFLLSAVPVPLVDLLEGDVEATGQLFDELGRPVGIPPESLLEELSLLVIQPMPWHFFLFMHVAAGLRFDSTIILRSQSSGIVDQIAGSHSLILTELHQPIQIDLLADLLEARLD